MCKENKKKPSQEKEIINAIDDTLETLYEDKEHTICFIRGLLAILANLDKSSVDYNLNVAINIGVLPDVIKELVIISRELARLHVASQYN